MSTPRLQPESHREKSGSDSLPDGYLEKESAVQNEVEPEEDVDELDPYEVPEGLPDTNSEVPDGTHFDTDPDLQDAPSDIAALAYSYYEDRGNVHGLDYDDWIRAEQELATRPGMRMPRNLRPRG